MLNQQVPAVVVSSKVAKAPPMVAIASTRISRTRLDGAQRVA